MYITACSLLHIYITNILFTCYLLLFHTYIIVCMKNNIQHTLHSKRLYKNKIIKLIIFYNLFLYLLSHMLYNVYSYG